ncbi:MAG TPA: sodium-independent anion transporter, partial [Planctomycetota bacterium]|nr:sodium-independent anion transporter [Planctomycetota bacterium]
SGAVVYDLAGPLFFGAAQRALGALGAISDGARIVIFDMAQVPVMDATGLVAFESALEELHRQGRVAILSGLQKQPRHILRRSGTLDRVPGTVLCATLPHALLVAESHPARLSAAAAPAR